MTASPSFCRSVTGDPLARFYKHIPGTLHAGVYLQMKGFCYPWQEESTQRDSLIDSVARDAFHRSQADFECGRKKGRPAPGGRLLGPGVAIVLGTAPRPCLHTLGRSEGDADGGHGKAEAD